MSILDLVETFHHDLAHFMKMPGWKSLYIDYEPPIVERLWLQVGDYRYCIHRIHKCDTALLHPHPWPSAMKVLEGEYQMGIGMSETHERPKHLETICLRVGSSYSMEDPRTWHSVRPVSRVSYSLMVMGKPYPNTLRHDHSKYGKGQELQPLTDRTVTDIRCHMNVLKP